MGHLNSICLLSILVLGVYFINTPYGYASEETAARWIGVYELATLTQEKGLVIIDLRTPHEFEKGHLPGALNVPIEDLRYRGSLLDVYKDKPILLYCRTVNKTARAIRIIKDRGFKSLFALRGGYEEFKLYNR